MDEYAMMGLSSLAEINYLRLEAMELFERCLTEGRPNALETFIEQQISREPPLLELLREIAEDLHQRLISLRENRSELQAKVTRTLIDDFNLEISAFAMGDPLLEIEKKLADQDNLSEEVRKMLDKSLQTAAQLRDDIAMTERLHLYLLDWLNALNATVARRFWVNGRGDQAKGVH